MDKGFVKIKDKRRILFDWATGNFKSAKAIVVLDDTPIGDHHHNNKDEEFFLLTGNFLELHLGEAIAYGIPAPYKVIVNRGVYHKFVCEPGSVLLGVASELFDENDEIK